MSIESKLVPTAPRQNAWASINPDEKKISPATEQTQENPKEDPRVKEIYQNYLKWKEAARNLGKLGPNQLKGLPKNFKPSIGKFKGRGRLLSNWKKIAEAEAVFQKYGLSPQTLYKIEQEAEKRAASATHKPSERRERVKGDLESAIRLLIQVNQKKKPQSHNETNYTDTPSNRFAEMEKPPQWLSAGMVRFFS
jgi:hypothetical protein